MKETVLFACVHNAGRSQMAAAFLRARVDARRVEVRSGGSHPGERVHPEVVIVMRELGLELAGERPTPIDARQPCDLFVTLGCGEACSVAARAHEDWPVPDPKGRPLEAVRAIRDELRARVEDLVRRRGWAREAAPDPATCVEGR